MEDNLVYHHRGREMVVFQTGLTGSTGCVLLYDCVHTVVMEAKSK